MTLYLSDHLASMDAATLACGAHRTGVPSARPRIVAAAWTQPSGARRLLRRADEAGGGALLRLLVEHAGAPVQLTDAMRAESRRLCGWSPVACTETTATLPLEIGIALSGNARVERGFVATLVGRTAVTDLVALADELGVATRGTEPTLRRRVARAILAAPDDAIDADAAAELARIGHLRNAEVDGVRPVAGQAGRAFDVETAGGTFRIAPREHADRLGLHFEAPEFEARSGATSTARRRLPTVLPVGALVTFSTTRATDDALKEPAFRDLILHRIDERRVVTRASVSAAEARACLTRLGFDLSTLAEGARRARS